MPPVWSGLYYIESRRKSRSGDNGAGGISSCLVWSLVCALHGKSEEGWPTQISVAVGTDLICRVSWTVGRSPCCVRRRD